MPYFSDICTILMQLFISIGYANNLAVCFPIPLGTGGFLSPVRQRGPPDQSLLMYDKVSVPAT